MRTDVTAASFHSDSDSVEDVLPVQQDHIMNPFARWSRNSIRAVVLMTVVLLCMLGVGMHTIGADTRFLGPQKEVNFAMSGSLVIGLASLRVEGALHDDLGDYGPDAVNKLMEDNDRVHSMFVMHKHHMLHSQTNVTALRRLSPFSGFSISSAGDCPPSDDSCPSKSCMGHLDSYCPTKDCVQALFPALWGHCIKSFNPRKYKIDRAAVEAYADDFAAADTDKEKINVIIQATRGVATVLLVTNLYKKCGYTDDYATHQVVDWTERFSVKHEESQY